MTINDYAWRCTKLGMARADRGDFEDAIADFSASLRAGGNSVIFFERGRAYWHVGRFQEAAADLLRAAQGNPEDPTWLFHIYFLLGDSYRQIGSHDRAVFNLGIALRYRADAGAYLSRGLGLSGEE